MAVDFADKFRDQEGEKWALRNAKLRFSRRLIFLTGMLACFSWRLHGLRSSSPEVEQTAEKAFTTFEDYFSRPPLEILASELIYTEAPPEISRPIFSSYNKFLAIAYADTSRPNLQP